MDFPGRHLAIRLCRELHLQVRSRQAGAIAHGGLWPKGRGLDQKTFA
jgi:hypothetical protein